MLGGADNPNGELPSYITGADTDRLRNFMAGHAIRWQGTGSDVDVQEPEKQNPR